MAKLTVFRLSVGCRQVGDLKGNTVSAIFMAARDGHLECVEQLIGAGADVNNGCIAGAFANATPLYAASQNGHAEVVKLLLAPLGSADADKACTDDETTPLFIASQEGHAEVVRLLLAPPGTADADLGVVLVLGVVLGGGVWWLELDVAWCLLVLVFGAWSS